MTYVSIYMALCSTDSHSSVSLKVLEGNIIWPKTVRMLKFLSYHNIYESACKLQKNRLGFFGLNIFFQLNLNFAF